jgi:hypothetical protein
MFTSITFFTSLDATRGFAGDDFELAVVEAPPFDTRVTIRWDMVRAGGLPGVQFSEQHLDCVLARSRNA